MRSAQGLTNLGWGARWKAMEQPGHGVAERVRLLAGSIPATKVEITVSAGEPPAVRVPPRPAPGAGARHTSVRPLPERTRPSACRARAHAQPRVAKAEWEARLRVLFGESLHAGLMLRGDKKTQGVGIREPEGEG